MSKNDRSPTKTKRLDSRITSGILDRVASEARFADVKRMLESAGYQLDRIRGSHHVFTKAGAPLVVVPVHRGKVKPYYVRQVKKIVEGD